MSTVESAGAVSDRCHLQEAVILQTRQRLHVEIAREIGHRCLRGGNDISTMLLCVCDGLKDELLSCLRGALHRDGRYTTGATAELAFDVLRRSNTSTATTELSLCPWQATADKLGDPASGVVGDLFGLPTFVDSRTRDSLVRQHSGRSTLPLA